MNNLQDLRAIHPTDRCWAAVRHAATLAGERGHKRLTTAHLLLGLLCERAATPTLDAILAACELTPAALRELADRLLAEEPSGSITTKVPDLEITAEVKNACAVAHDDARRTNADIGTTTVNLFVGMLSMKSPLTERLAMKGVTPQLISATHEWMIAAMPAASQLGLIVKALQARTAGLTKVVVEKGQLGARATAQFGTGAELQSDWLTNEYTAVGDLFIRFGDRFGVQVQLPR